MNWNFICLLNKNVKFKYINVSDKLIKKEKKLILNNF